MTTLKQLAPKLLDVITEAQTILTELKNPNSELTREGVLRELEVLLNNQDLIEAIMEVQSIHENPFEKFHPESSQIARTKFLPEQNILEVEFKSNGKIYHYAGFPIEMWQQAKDADSIGSFVNKQVKGKYEYQLVGIAGASKLMTGVQDESKAINAGGL